MPRQSCRTSHQQRYSHRHDAQDPSRHITALDSEHASGGRTSGANYEASDKDYSAYTCDPANYYEASDEDRSGDTCERSNESIVRASDKVRSQCRSTAAKSNHVSRASKTIPKDESKNEQRAITNPVSGRYLGLEREQFEALRTKVIDAVRAQETSKGRFRFYENVDSAVKKLLEEGIPQDLLYRMVRRIAPDWNPPNEPSTNVKPQRFWPKSISVVVAKKK